MRKIIRGGTVVTAADTAVADVLVDGEEIAAVGTLGDVDAEVIDATGCFVLPGLIDNHTHMAMPFGGTHSIDDYDTGTRAAAAGGTTCIVDFVIQQHGGGLRSSLEEWQERAAGAAHVDYGFHMAITQADEGTFADMEPMVERGALHLQGLPRLQGPADGHRRPLLPRARDDARPRRDDDGARRERVGDRRPRAARAGGGQAAADPPRAHASRAARGRGHRPRRALRRAHGRPGLHRPRHVRAGRRRDRARPGARRERVRRDLPPVPHEHRRGPRAARLRGRALRVLAAAARREQPAEAVVGAQARRAGERLDRPLPVQLRAEGARPRGLLQDPQRPGDDPAPAGEAVGPRRGERAAHAVAARRADLDARSPTASGWPARARSRPAWTPTS